MPVRSYIPEPKRGPRKWAGFDEAYFHDVRFLDFSKPGPIIPRSNWIVVSSRELEHFRSALERMVDTHIGYLNPDEVEIFETLQNAVFLNYLRDAPGRMRLAQRPVEATVRIVLLPAQLGAHHRLPRCRARVGTW